MFDNASLAALNLSDRIKAIRDQIEGKIVFTTSLGIEDQLLTHHIAETGVNIDLATLETGRLFEESHTLWQETEEKYGIVIRGFYPNAEAIAKFVAVRGTNGFRQSVDLRKECCGIRKIEPLNRALDGANAWVTGLRADQSGARSDLNIIEKDEARGIYKINPLFDYTREMVVTEVKALGVPYNPLHDKGFLSIGCAPCTRAIEAGEPERAGRWWWESEEQGQKECGLHTDASGKLVRTVTIKENLA